MKENVLIRVMGGWDGQRVGGDNVCWVGKRQ